MNVQIREAEAKKPKKGTDIPIPMVRTLPSYGRDYLPVFREQTTYIRGRGGDLPYTLCQESLLLEKNITLEAMCFLCSGEGIVY